MIEIRFVYFDLGNVLVAFDRQIACRNLAELVDRKLQTVESELYESGLQDQLESGRIDERSYCLELRQRLGISAAIENRDILRAISDMFHPIESMQAPLETLRQQGMPFGILSNTCAAHWGWVTSQQYRVLQGNFDVTVVSHLAKSMKPDRVIYELAMSEAHRICGARPEQILFLDDREENVLAARSHGWQSEVCVGGPEAISVLQRYMLLSDVGSK